MKHKFINFKTIKKQHIELVILKYKQTNNNKKFQK